MSVSICCSEYTTRVERHLSHGEGTIIDSTTLFCNKLFVVCVFYDDTVDDKWTTRFYHKHNFPPVRVVVKNSMAFDQLMLFVIILFLGVVLSLMWSEYSRPSLCLIERLQ